jgi:hypothetical protein
MLSFEAISQDCTESGHEYNSSLLYFINTSLRIIQSSRQARNTPPSATTTVQPTAPLSPRQPQQQHLINLKQHKQDKQDQHSTVHNEDRAP